MELKDRWIRCEDNGPMAAGELGGRDKGTHHLLPQDKVFPLQDYLSPYTFSASNSGGITQESIPGFTHPCLIFDSKQHPLVLSTEVLRHIVHDPPKCSSVLWSPGALRCSRPGGLASRLLPTHRWREGGLFSLPQEEATWKSFNSHLMK